MRPIIWLIVFVSCIGCRAPMPPFKPYSNTRIPAPQTGSFGDPYYNSNPPAQPQSIGAASSQTVRASDTLLASHQDAGQAAEVDDELDWTSPQRGSSNGSSPRYQATIRRSTEGRVDRAGYEQPDASGQTIQTLSYEESDSGYSPGTTAVRRRNDTRGMPVNDATMLENSSTIVIPGGSTSGSWKAR